MRGSLTAVRLLTLLLFLLLIAICSYWALQILAPRPAIAPSASIGDAAAAPNLEPATVLFGSANAPTAAAASGAGNIQVSGVAEAGPEGVVILSIDGKPGAAFGVNSTVTEGTVVKSVGLDKVVLEQRGKLIELKTPTRASLDILSSGVGKARAPSDSSTAAPVSTRTLAPPPPPPPQPSQPQFQPPQPPQQQQMQQQQLQQQQEQLQQQQLQQQQLQQQQMQQQAGQAPGGQPLPPGGGAGGMSQGVGADPAQSGAAPGSSTAVSGQRQVPGQEPMPGLQSPSGQQMTPRQQPAQAQ
jgi:hypothetical protein